ncbi:hypothetical protein [Chryseobacterium oleae]|uniref:hypothetical protein n=1 Tax=Chryseobacterium oleae TaxID=491207 RepID=UPI000B7EBC4C|nr:hypothetical protein [Chryseobacterium oleae]
MRNKETLRGKLKTYICSEDTGYDEMTLSFLDINFSKEFTGEEKLIFINMLSELNFQIDDRTNK